MTGIATAIVGGGLLYATYESGQSSADAATSAANASIAAQSEQLAYLKEINALPQQYKEEALTKLASIYGLSGDTSGQSDLIASAKASPIYSAIMGGLESGEQSILRNAAATGGLRSGNTQSALADYATTLSNNALSEAYGQQLLGIKGLAGLSTDTSEIGDIIASIGETQAQGITSAAQAEAAGLQNTINTLLGIGSLIV